MRACQPSRDGYVERDGVKLHYEVYGAGEPTVLLLPTWSIMHSRHWKMQIPYLARHCRVLTFDGRGNGRSDRPTEPEAYAEPEFAADALAVMDATGTERAVLVGFSLGAHLGAGARRATIPSGSRGSSSSARRLPLAAECPWPSARRTRSPSSSTPTEGWAKYNQHYWLRALPGVPGVLLRRRCSPSRTPPSRSRTPWAGAWRPTPETLSLTHLASSAHGEPPWIPRVAELARRVAVPGAGHPRRRGRHPPVASGRRSPSTPAAAGAAGGLRHAPHVRDPVKVNLLLRDFVKPAPPPRRWVRGKSRRKRALYISSPIGLGHAQRDVAIAGELRKLHPDLEIDWLAQHPVTAVLEAHGERIHPASALLANESGHIESESAEHDLHCFQAIRRMDEILLANFMVFHDLVREEHYDLWIGDEAWELDYYLHENPEHKQAAYVWLTDFVGWLPMPDGGEREAFVAADYNAEMIEHIARFPRVRDQAIFVGNPDDIVPDAFGPQLPADR